MHPSFSVIFFTTASGAGFGLFAWLGWLAMAGQLPGRWPAGIALVFGAALAVAGLCSSLLHLGQPTRAWRAFSQWRSSWLSREGIAALACFAPALWLGAQLLRADDTARLASGPAMGVAGFLLLSLSLVTVGCTAMIYASLKPIPAWTHPLVLPLYLLFALFTGGLLLAAVFGLAGAPVPNMAGFGAVAGALLLWRLKRHVWRSIDQGRGVLSRSSALGLPQARAVRVFERPHTEANYLLREMGFVLARKHAQRLRTIALLLFAALPALLSLPLWLLPHFDAAGALMAIAAASALLGAVVERWLFFAEAKHLVTLYY